MSDLPFLSRVANGVLAWLNRSEYRVPTIMIGILIGGIIIWIIIWIIS